MVILSSHEVLWWKVIGTHSFSPSSDESWKPKAAMLIQFVSVVTDQALKIVQAENGSLEQGLGPLVLLEKDLFYPDGKWLPT